MTGLTLRERLHTVIFGTDTPMGKLFDVVLIYAILISVAVVMLDSIADIHLQYRRWLYGLEWFFTLLFTVEYLLRIYISPRPLRYIFSFYGIVDFLSILPTYLALLVTGASYLQIIRLIRVLRIFRVLKLARYSEEGRLLINAMVSSRRKIFVFFFAVLILSTVFGSLMFIVEGPEHGFTSIPKSIYWTIVTITTVGYGDITPETVMGQMISTLAMLTGYSIIAIPTGIVSAELIHEVGRERELQQNKRICPECGLAGHVAAARYCLECGASLSSDKHSTVE
jgi:voltage-gated potassium channel